MPGKNRPSSMTTVKKVISICLKKTHIVRHTSFYIYFHEIKKIWWLTRDTYIVNIYKTLESMQYCGKPSINRSLANTQVIKKKKFWVIINSEITRVHIPKTSEKLGMTETFSWQKKKKSLGRMGESSHCYSFEDQAPVDFIYGCPIFKWVAVTWLKDMAPGW